MAKDLEVQEGGATAARDYVDPPPAPLLDMEEFGKWSLYRAVIAEFVDTSLPLRLSPHRNRVQSSDRRKRRRS